MPKNATIYFLLAIVLLFSAPRLCFAQVAPPGYTKCADENGYADFSTKVDVAYGNNGVYDYKYGVTGRVYFNNSTFKDVVPGVVKAGFYKLAAPGAPISLDIDDIEDGVNPVSDADMKLILKWMADEAADANVEYCYRQSYGRGVGTPLSGCPQGTEKNGLLCYPLCSSGYSGEGPVCWQGCPSGFRNDGAFCAKPAAYGRGAGYPWKFGDALNLDAARKRCQNANPQGCEKHGEIIYPKCKHGFSPAGCCVCSPICPNGMTDIGVSCAKKSYGRGAGSPMKCAAGLQEDAGLCYPSCRPGYHGVGPVCWQDCPPNQPVNCAAGCAKTSMACAEKTIDQVTAVAMLAANIISMGSTSKVAAAKTALKTAIKAGDKVAAKAALKATVKGLVEGFEQLTTKIVMQKLKQKLQTNTIKWVAKEYAKVLLKVEMQKEFSVDDLRDLSGLDPTGVADVVNAFWQPVCAKKLDFPVLSKNYF